MIKKIIVAIVRTFLKLIFKLKIVGINNLAIDGGFVLTANHKSNWDVLVLYTAMTRDIFFMAKAELFKVPLFAWFLKQFGAFPVKRGENDLAAIKHAIGILNKNKILGIFPQGHRTDDLNVDDAKGGAVLLASRCNKPIVPAAIVGDYKFRGEITVIFGEPIYFSERKLSQVELAQETETVMAKIKGLVESI